MKDPEDILVEIEEIEKLEAESLAEVQPNEKGLAEKKRKLHGTLDRVLKYYVSEPGLHDLFRILIEPCLLCHVCCRSFLRNPCDIYGREWL